MTDTPSVRLQRCLDRLRGGDIAARDEIFRYAGDRLERLTRRMLQDYQGVRRWEDTVDVMQNAVLRLCRALDDVGPTTVRDFYRLAALQIRRELIDLVRHHYGPEGPGLHHASNPTGQSSAGVGRELAERSGGPSAMSAWSEFHEKVQGLPPDEREVFDLLWYQGLKQEDAGEVLGISTRTVKSRWRAARLRLVEAMGGELPDV